MIFAKKALNCLKRSIRLSELCQKEKYAKVNGTEKRPHVNWSYREVS